MEATEDFQSEYSYSTAFNSLSSISDEISHSASDKDDKYSENTQHLSDNKRDCKNKDYDSESFMTESDESTVSVVSQDKSKCLTVEHDSSFEIDSRQSKFHSTSLATNTTYEKKFGNLMKLPSKQSNSGVLELLSDCQATPNEITKRIYSESHKSEAIEEDMIRSEAFDGRRSSNNESDDENISGDSFNPENSNPCIQMSSTYNYSDEEFDSLSLSQSHHSFTRFSRHFSGSEFSLNLHEDGPERRHKTDSSSTYNDDDDSDSSNEQRRGDSNSRASYDSQYSQNDVDADSSNERKKSDNRSRNSINSQYNHDYSKSEYDNTTHGDFTKADSESKIHVLGEQTRRKLMQLDRQGRIHRSDINSNDNYLEHLSDDYTEDFETLSPDFKSESEKSAVYDTERSMYEEKESEIQASGHLEPWVDERRLEEKPPLSARSQQPGVDGEAEKALRQFVRVKLNIARRNQRTNQKRNVDLAHEQQEYKQIHPLYESSSEEESRLRSSLELQKFCKLKKRQFECRQKPVEDQQGSVQTPTAVYHIHPLRYSNVAQVPLRFLQAAKYNNNLSRIEQVDMHEPGTCQHCRDKIDKALLWEFTAKKISLLEEKQVNDYIEKSFTRDGLTLLGEFLSEITALRQDPDSVFDLLLRPLHHKST